MTSVLQGGRRRRRPGGRLARLLVVLAPLAVIAAVVGAFRHDHSHQSAPAPSPPVRSQEQPGATPSPGTAAPDPAQAALAGVDAFHLRFSDPPRAGIVFDVHTGEVLWRRNPLKRLPIASLTKVMTALLVVER